MVLGLPGILGVGGRLQSLRAENGIGCAANAQRIISHIRNHKNFDMDPSFKYLYLPGLDGFAHHHVFIYLQCHQLFRTARTAAVSPGTSRQRLAACI